MPIAFRRVLPWASLLASWRAAAGLRLDATTLGQGRQEPQWEEWPPLEEAKAARSAGLGLPPYTRKQGDLDEIFEGKYPFSSQEMAAWPASGNYDQRFASFFDKLEKGLLVRILVLGGSMTAGEGCRRPGLYYGLCAWPQALVKILQEAYPNSRIKLMNEAHRGVTSSVIVAGLGLELRSIPDRDAIDLVLLDTLVNDAFEGKKWMSESAVELETGDVVSISYEVLVRSLQTLLPHAGVVSVVGGCPECIKMRPRQVEVAEHYQLPLVDFGALAAERNDLWWPPVTHPFAPTHQLMADVIAGTFSKALREIKARGRVVPAFSPAAPLHTEEELDFFPTCLQPLSGYSADIAIHDTSAPRPTVVKGWRLFEDRKDKPGWISEEENATMTFDLKFGRRPHLALTFLKSYEGLGDMSVSMNGRTVSLSGLWGRANHEKVSQSYTLWFNASGTECPATAAGVWARETDTFCLGVQPNSNATMEVVGRHGKNKLIGLLSC